MVKEKIGDIPPEKENEKVAKKIKMLLARSQEDEWESVAWVQLKEWNLKQKAPLNEGELRKLFENTTSQESNSREEDEGDDELKILKSIIFSEENLTYFLDQLKDVYVRVKADKCFEIMRLDSGRFKSWIIKKYNDLTDNIPTSGNIKKVLSLLRAKAVYGDKKYELSIRGAYSGGCIWYDLVNDEYKAIKIDKTGWAVIDTPPILFKRNIQNEQIVPERGGSVLDLLKFVNIKGEKQRLLFLVSTITYFIPNIPRPIQVYFGSQGSAKSTTNRIVKSVVDPSKVELLTLLNETRELTQQLDQHYLLSFDNLASLEVKTSDTLCRAVTGGGLSKRKLYTDSDNVIFEFKRAIIINGVNLVANKPDLLDRSLLFELERIEEENRKAEEDFWQEFNLVKPKILGAIFDALSKALIILPAVKLEKTPRMADFAKWGCAIAEAIGYTQKQFVEAYEENYGMQNRQAIEENPVASAILMLVGNRKNWNGTSRDLLKEIKAIAEKEDLDMKFFPKSPSALSRKVNEVRSNLLSESVKIEKIGQRNWNIEKV
ncbi:MAG: hypothetical protein WA064_03390 [Candidatus Moraniibacteriota bacterium]